MSDFSMFEILKNSSNQKQDGSFMMEYKIHLKGGEKLQLVFW